MHAPAALTDSCAHAVAAMAAVKKPLSEVLHRVEPAFDTVGAVACAGAEKAKHGATETAKKAGQVWGSLYTRFGPFFAAGVVEIIVLSTICLIVMLSVVFAFWTAVFSFLGIGLLGLNLIAFVCLTTAAVIAAPFIIGTVLCLGVPLVLGTFGLGLAMWMFRSSPAAERALSKLQQHIPYDRIESILHRSPAPVGKVAEKSEEAVADHKGLPKIVESAQELANPAA